MLSRDAALEALSSDTFDVVVVGGGITGAGVALDAAARGYSVAVVELLPALRDRAPTSGYLFYDCQTDDVRLVLTVLGEAERFGTVMGNRVEVTDVTPDGVRAVDTVTDTPFAIRAANVVNATGVW